MKQLGNLAIICAQRPDALLQIMDGKATVFLGYGPCRTRIVADWHDDQKISEITHELNHGRYRLMETEKGAFSA